jgi:quercetin dioxygenase-like cupin family protein
MENITLDFLAPLPIDNRAFSTSFQTFDLPVLIEKMKHSHTWESGELHAMILLRNPGKKVVLAALHEGTEINSFQSDDSITFQIIEGKIKFHSRNESLTLGKGQLLTLHEKVKYSLTTREEAILLLTIAKNILQPVEN